VPRPRQVILIVGHRHAIYSLHKSGFAKIIAWIARIGADPNDSEDIRLKKLLFVFSVLFFATPPSTIGGISYYNYGELLAGLLLLAFAALGLLIVFLLSLMPRYYTFLMSCELLNVLLMPYLVTVTMGGLKNLSVSMVWSFMCPLGALVMAERKIAFRWFVAYLILFVSLFFLQPYLRSSNNMPPSVALVRAMLTMVMASSVTFLLFNYFVSQRDIFQEKADNLLLNILPEKIAKALKAESRTIADHFVGASVLFADIVNFTPMSAKMTPVELVELLNEVFSYFDTLVEKYGLEKIKTIGDCYMAASGVPHPRSDHACILTHFALDIRDYVSQHEFRGKRLTFRIGINSGPVIAGVIGRKKFIYDLWGDTVNKASRMESHGDGGFIHVTEATYKLIKEDFICESRGNVNVKGKGQMKVWYVLNKGPENRPTLG